MAGVSVLVKFIYFMKGQHSRTRFYNFERRSDAIENLNKKRVVVLYVELYK